MRASRIACKMCGVDILHQMKRLWPRLEMTEWAAIILLACASAALLDEFSRWLAVV